MKGDQHLMRRSGMAAVTWLIAGAALSFAFSLTAHAQLAGARQQSVQERIRALTDAMNRVESQLEQSQHDLAELRQELASLRTSAGDENSPDASSSTTTQAAELAAAVAEIRETQAMQQTQIATLDQSKVESASKYPIKISGMVLFNGFVNTRQVDTSATPSVALSGSGSTGASARQSLLGIDVSGPQILGAQTHGDLRLDFSANAATSTYSGSYALGLIRLRTAHVDMNWNRSEAFFAFDRPLIAPETPSSLTAVALPALAWSGNLWAWNPQVGISYDSFSTRVGSLRAEAALIDVADPPSLLSTTSAGLYAPPSTAELSRWPGIETRIAWERSNGDSSPRIGASGYFAPHRTPNSQFTFDSWAGAVDFRIPATRLMQFSGSAYSGSALGGLGGGAFKDYVVRYVNYDLYWRALDDRGGWFQWKQKAGERIEFNEAFGIDDVPARQLRPYAIPTSISDYNLARNRTLTGNITYSPNAYLLFSLEYRRIMSSYVIAPTSYSDVVGIATGYKF